MTLPRTDATRKILLSADRGLWGQVPPPLRAWSFSFDAVARTITFRAEVDKAVVVEDDNWEDLSLASGEASADLLLGEGTQVKMEVLLVPPGQPLDPLPDGVVFLRAGERVPDNYGGAMPHPRSRAHLIPHFPPKDE